MINLNLFGKHISSAQSLSQHSLCMVEDHLAELILGLSEDQSLLHVFEAEAQSGHARQSSH